MDIKKAQTFAIRSQVHHKPNILWGEVRANKARPNVYSFARFLFRGGDSRAVEPICLAIIAECVCKYTAIFQILQNFSKICFVIMEILCIFASLY